METLVVLDVSGSGDSAKARMASMQPSASLEILLASLLIPKIHEQSNIPERHPFYFPRTKNVALHDLRDNAKPASLARFWTRSSERPLPAVCRSSYCHALISCVMALLDLIASPAWQRRDRSLTAQPASPLT